MDQVLFEDGALITQTHPLSLPPVTQEFGLVILYSLRVLNKYISTLHFQQANMIFEKGDRFMRTAGAATSGETNGLASDVLAEHAVIDITRFTRFFPVTGFQYTDHPASE